MPERRGLFPAEVHVSQDSYLDSDSTVAGSTNVFSSALISAEVEDSLLVGTRLYASRLITTIAIQSCLQGLQSRDCVLDNVRCIGKPIIRLDGVTAERCALFGQWSLTAHARIVTGAWWRPPRYWHIVGDGNDLWLTESVPGWALMACWHKPIDKWLRAGPRLGRKSKWSEEQIQQAREFFTLLLDVPLGGVTATPTKGMS